MDLIVWHPSRTHLLVPVYTSSCSARTPGRAGLLQANADRRGPTLFLADDWVPRDVVAMPQFPELPQMVLRVGYAADPAQPDVSHAALADHLPPQCASHTSRLLERVQCRGRDRPYGRPPHRSQRAGLPHWAPTLGVWRRRAPPGRDASRAPRGSHRFRIRTIRDQSTLVF